MSIIEGAPADSIWKVTGRYPDGTGTFTDCLAIVMRGEVTGTDKTILRMLPPLWDFITADDVDKASAVIYDPFAGYHLPATEVVQIANETSDRLGNLYRLDFIDRIRHEAQTNEENN